MWSDELRVFAAVAVAVAAAAAWSLRCGAVVVAANSTARTKWFCDDDGGGVVLMETSDARKYLNYFSVYSM